MQDGELVRRPRGLWIGVGLIAGALSLAPAAAAQTAPDPDAKPVFLVTDVVVDEGAGIDKEAARDALANRFGRLREKIEVRSLAEVKTTMDRAAVAQMLGSSSSDDEIGKIGDYVAVDRLVFGRIAQVAGVTEVQVKIFNTKEGVTEIGLSRRLKAGAPPQLVLTLLDTLADGLLAFVIDTYTDGVPDAKFAALKNKKIERRAPEEPAAPGSPWGMLGVVGGSIAGAGVGIATLGGIALAEEGNQGGSLPLILAGAGAGAVIVGTGLVIIDGLTE
jgi:hypothetical protein